MQQHPPGGPYGGYPYQPPRRDRTALVVVLAIVALVVAVAVAVTLVLVLRSGDDGPAALRQPLRIEQVTEETPGLCADASGVPSRDGRSCYRLVPGMTVRQVIRIEARTSDSGDPGWHILISMGPADAAAFGSLTGRVAAEQPPRNRLALVVDGKVLSAPTVQQAITGGEVQISGAFTRQEAERLVGQMAGTSP